MGGLGHGSGLGCAGRAGPCAQDRFLSFERRFRRRIQEGVRAMSKQKQVGFVTMGAIAAAEAGKHVVCEKPLGRTAEESYDIWQSVAKTGVKHMCAFNYRFVPAVRLAREMLEAGELGEIYHFRGRYLQEWITDPGFQ